MPSSPLNPQPSPMASQSPGPSMSGSGYMQSGHLDGSPFASASMASPAASNWPGSPGMPRPSPARPGQSPAHNSPQADQRSGSHHSRVLPQRSWAGAVPTLITHEALDTLCQPGLHPQSLPGPEMSPLERFLGCVYMRRQLQRFIQTEDCLTGITSTEPGVVFFKVESLQCRVGLNPQHLQSLHIKVSPLPEHKDQWNQDELQIIEKFFDSRAATPPYKPNSLSGFGRILNVPYSVLKDFVQIMRLELLPALGQAQQHKWAVQWALRIPPSAAPLVPPGMAGVMVCRNKILFYLQITRLHYQAAGDPPSLILPLVYDVPTNLTQLAEKKDPSQASVTTAANHQLKRFADSIQFSGNVNNECSIFPAVRDLLINLVLPNDPLQISNQQVVPSPVGVGVGSSPSPAMMHSPMGGGVNMPSGAPAPPFPPLQSMQNPMGPS